jgi:hypothetical protein
MGQPQFEVLAMRALRSSQSTLSHRINVCDDPTYLTAGQVRLRYGGVSHMWLIRRMQDSGFPAPSYFGRLRFWRLSDLESWERLQAEKPPQRRPTGFQTESIGSQHKKGAAP